MAVVKDYSAVVKKGPTMRAKRLFVGGIEGVGKTTFLTQCPNPIVVCAEDGLTENAFAGIANYTPESWPDLLGFIDYLTTANHTYQTIGFDTEDWLEHFAVKFICNRDGKSNIEEYGFSKGQSVILPNEFRQLLAKLEVLQQKKNIMVVFTSHIQVKTFNNPAGDNYDRYEASGTKQVVSLIKQWCDVNLFATFEVVTKKDSKKGKAKGMCTDARIVHTTYSAAWDAKNRCGLPETLPFDAQTILEAIAKGTPDNPENIYADAVDLAGKYLTDATIKKNTLAYLEKNKTNVPILTVALNKLRHIQSQAETEKQPEPETQAA